MVAFEIKNPYPLRYHEDREVLTGRQKRNLRRKNKRNKTLNQLSYDNEKRR